ncbi:MAG: amino acid adenylation domain-containing protein [Acidobacteriota bacterium]|nr:amino acid adenylation domain-containing protein [Acidobacteriota bacterium]
MTVPIDRANLEDVYELSPLQQGLLFHAVRDTAGGAYLEQLSLVLRGPLDRRAFEETWRQLMARHAVLRSAFLWDDLEKPAQLVLRQVPVPLDVLDWSDLPAGDQPARLDAFLAGDRARGYALDRAPLMRLTLVRLDDDRHLLVWSHHHLLLDGWSTALLLQEALAIYGSIVEGRPTALEAPRPYRDFITWVRRQDAAAAEAYWRRALADLDGPTPVPLATPAGTRDAAPIFDEQRMDLSPEDTQAFHATCRRERLTPGTVLQGAWSILLGRLTGRRTVVSGTTVSGRPAGLPGADRMVGLLINSLPVRADPEMDRPAAAWLRDFQQQLADMRQFEAVPLTRIQQWSSMPAGAPLFETLVVFENYPAPAGGAGGASGLRVEDVRAYERTHYPLTLVSAPGDTLPLRLLHDRTRVSAPAARRLLSALRELLRSFVADAGRPAGDLNLLTGADRRELDAWNRAVPEAPDGGPVTAAIAAHAAAAGDTPAVRSDDEVLSYRALDVRANRLAHFLQRTGVGVEDRVGICMDRTPALIVSLLATLKAGAAYVPLDPSYPADRLALMAADAKVRLVLADRANRTTLDAAGLSGVPIHLLEEEAAAIEAMPAAAPDVSIDPDTLAYVIYTSGSTGRPKGVAVSHRNLMNLVGWHGRAFGLTSADRCTLAASFGFDASVWETWPALAAGATLDLVPAGLLLDPPALRDRLVERAITVSFVPTPVTEQLLALDWPRDAALRLLLTGGDRLTHFASDRLPFTLVNNYGPTEHTVVATSGPVGTTADETRMPDIGRPIAGTRAYVLDARLNPLPPGADGELFLSGPSVARGYQDAPDQTAERFLPDPFTTVPGTRMYRTGDRVRLLSDGRMAFVGRTDDQIKLRGFRIEPAEIEAVLAAHPAVREAAVLLREDRPGHPRLVAYVAQHDDSVPFASLEAFLGSRLPEYMVPRVWVALHTFPMTPNGKIDRRALPVPEAPAAADATPGAWVDAFEELLAGIWQDLLSLDVPPSPEDDFFASGGHSLLALRLVTAIRRTWALDVPLTVLFERSSLRRMAAAIRERSQAAASAPLAPPLTHQRRDGDLPLSFPQERLWFLEQLPKSAQAYHISLGFRLDGVLRQEVLERTIGEIVRRHEVLRTTFHLVDGRPVARVEPAGPVAFTTADLATLPPEARDEALASIAEEEAAHPFALDRGPLVRGLIVRLADRQHALLITVHHIAADGWSMGVLTREFPALYAAFAAGRPSPLPEPELQYSDFAVWQRAWLDAATRDRLLDFWRGQVAGAEPLDLPADRPRPAVQSYRGRTIGFTVPSTTADALRALARDAHCTPYMAGLAAFSVLLARLSGQRDFLIGSPVAGRDAAGAEGLVGCFVNTLALRCRPGMDQPFRACVDAVRSRLLQAYAHQQLPFEQLVQAVVPERDLSRAPLFQVMFVWQHASSAPVDLLDLRWTPFAVDGGAAKFDLTLTMTEGRDGLAGNVEYSTDLFDAATMERFVGYWLRLLDAAVATPDTAAGDLPIMPDAERDLVVRTWNGTARDWPDASRLLHELVEAQVRRTPDAVALRFEGASLTYRELDRRAGALAGRLRRAGIGPDAIVGICLERSFDLVVSLLATFKAGGAYLPLDPDYPSERLRFMLGESAAPVVLTSSALQGRLPSHPGVTLCVDRDEESPRDPDAPARPAVDPDHLAYVIYTSGSTGRPKGAGISHRAIVNRLLWMQEAFHLTPADRVLQKTPYSFDVSVWEFFWPLTIGAELVIARPRGHQDPAYLRDLIVERGVTVLHFVPSMLEIFLDAAGIEACTSLTQVFSSGEALSPDLQARFFGRLGAALHNLYGPTEAAVDVTSWTCTADAGPAPVPIGRPIANIRTWVLDERLQAVPIGVPGELYLGGVGLARGYLHRPGLTGERFVPAPYGPSGERLYRTGDRVRFRPDGAIEYLGRLDHQVKLRGFRIELGEIEAALARHPGVRQSVVVLRDTAPGGPQLVAYLVGDGPLALGDLRTHLLATLPDYMVPGAFVLLDALPLTASGKVDRQSLPAPEGAAVVAGAGRTAPRSAVESLVAALWAELLHREALAVEDNFFELGGHSLLATQMLARVKDIMQTPLPMLSIFEAPTVGGFAQLIDAAAASPGRAEEIARAWLTLRRLSPDERARLLAREHGDAV